MQTDYRAERIIGIDLFRYLLCFPVSLIHAMPQIESKSLTFVQLIAVLISRVAVPFFFISSGYFIRIPEIFSIRILMQPLIRLLLVYFAWSLIYNSYSNIVCKCYQNFNLPMLITAGQAYHLWFLPVLGVTITAASAAIILIGWRLTSIFAAILAIAGLFFGAYQDMLDLPKVGGVRLMMAPALVMIGYWFARTNLRLSTWVTVFGILMSLILSFSEELMISTISGETIRSHHMVLMTYPLGAFTFLLALTVPQLKWIAPIARLGQISLGIYASHLIFLLILESQTFPDGPASPWAMAVSATLMATALSLLISRIKFLQKLVR